MVKYIGGVAMASKVASLSNRAKWGILALVFAFTQFIPMINISGLAMAGTNDLSVSTHQGQQYPSGTYTSGNVTTYKEGDFIQFRFNLKADAASSGVMSVNFSDYDGNCHFFTNIFQLGNIDNVSGTSPNVQPSGAPVSDGLEWTQLLQVTATTAGEATIYYKLQLSQEAGECNGSSQHSRLDDVSGDFKNIGQQNVPVPANQIIELPDITVIKNIDTDGDGVSNRPANAGEWQFSLDGGSPVATDANGKVVFTNVTPDGDHTIVESNGPSNQTFLSGSGTNCTFNSSKATATIAQGTTATDATCTFLNTVKKGSITIIKDADPDSSQVFNYTATGSNVSDFTLKDDGNAANNTKTFSNLLPGSYSFSETNATNWDLKNIICNGATNSIIDATKPTASITLAAGENITCTFSNVKRGTLIVQKTTLPANDTTSFSITASTNNGELVGSPAGTITDANDYTYTVKPGTYSVSETVPTGWQKTGDTCQNVTVAAGETKTCLITNTKLGSITISKEAVPNSEQDFNFTTTGTGLSNFTLDDDADPTYSKTKTFNNLLPGTYTVTEETADGWYFDGFTSCSGDGVTKDIANRKVTITLAAGANISCQFENRIYGQIIVQKTTFPSGSTQQFSVEATSSDGGVIIGNSTSSVTDATDAKFVIQQGKTYAVSETTPDGWLEYSNNCSGLSVNGNSTLVEGIPTVYCEIINNQKASLTITKVTSPKDSPDSFTFNATGLLSDNFSLTDGQSKTYNFDPNGKLKITESTNIGDGWDLFSINCGDNDQVSIDITAGFVEFDPEPGETASCTFTNNQAPVLTLLKQLSDNLYGSGAKIGDFTLSASNATEQSNDFSGTSGVNSQEEVGDTFQAGTYALSESSTVWAETQYVKSDWSCLLNDQAYDFGDNINQIKLGIGDNATCWIVNSTKPGKVIVYKKVITDNGGGLSASNFAVKIDKNSNDYTSFGINDSGLYTDYTGAVVFDNLDANTTFAVNEKDAYASSYEITENTCANDFTVDNGETIECFITNDDKPGYLIVKKNVINDNGGSALPSDFDIKYLNTSVGAFTEYDRDDSQSLVKYKTDPIQLNAFNGYSISELDLSGYQEGDWNCSQNSDTSDNRIVGEFNIANGQTVECEITNNDIAPKLSLVKVVKADDGGSKDPNLWTLTVKDQSGATVFSGQGSANSDSSFKAGTYTLHESGPSGYTAGPWECTGGGILIGNELTIKNGESVACTIKNDDNTPSLRLIKDVDNNNGGNAEPGDWTLSARKLCAVVDTNPDCGFSDKGDSATATFHEILANTQYRLFESGPSGYEFKGWKCDGGTLLGNKITLGLDEDVTCVVKNDDIAPKLTIIKSVTKDNGGTAQPDDFKLTVDGVDVLSGVSNEYDANKALVINETKLTGYEFKSITGDAKCPSILGGTVTLDEGDDVTCTITNDDIAPSLTLIKKVSNDNGGTAVTKDWELKAAGPSTIYGDGGTTSDATFKAGEYTLSESSSKWTTDQYEPSEWSCKGDTTNYGSSITLTVGQSATCTITNDDIAPKLTVEKFIIPEGYSTDQKFDFVLKDDESITVDTASLGDGESKTFENLVAGEYSLSEQEVEHWLLSEVYCTGEQDPSKLELEIGKEYTCTFYNEPLGSIEITKYWDKNENYTRDDYFNQGIEPALEGITFRLWSSPTDYEEAETDEDGIASFTDLRSRYYLIEELTPEGWRTTENSCMGYDNGYERERSSEEIPEDAIFLDYGQAFECTVGNASNNYSYNIAKTNNATTSKRVGDTVIYTITLTIPNDTGVLYNPLVGDAPPTGFNYLGGSWTANSNLRGNLKPGVSIEPTYASPGIWKFNGFDMYFDDGNSVPNNAFYPGEVITLTYQTKIESDVSPGTYPDVALSFAFNTSDEQMQNSDTRVLANVTGQEGDDPFVGTSVTVITDPVEPEQVLVNTGSGAIWALVFGSSLIALGFATRRLSASERGIK